MSNKRIIIEEYSSDFDYKKNFNHLAISFNRVAFIFFIFFIIFIIFSLKTIYLSKENFVKKSFSLNNEFRSTILDRNGVVLAKSIITNNIGINPKEIINKDKLLINLKLIFPNKDFSQILKKIDKGKFFYLEKKVSRKDYRKLILLGDKSIKFEQKISRVYPQKNLFSHVLGQIDDDNNGISGIEKFYDYELKNNNNPITLSLDANIQYLIRQELIAANKIFQNIGSAAILMNIDSGEILSLISFPDFDLNKRDTIIDVNYINRATKAVYELGSVFKTFTFAAGLNEGVIKTDTPFINLEKKIFCGGNPIGEYDNEIPRDLTAEEILIRSGNIGSVRIAQKLGVEKFRNFLNDLGILKKISFDIHEIGQPHSLNWGKCKLATSSFGHGITTTPLQLSVGYAIISNGGYKIKPTLIKDNNIDKYQFKRILDDDVSNKVNFALRKVVSTKEGTAGFADVKGYDVGGKTGTAQKSINGKYSKEKINTFVSIFPSSKPKYVLMVLLDEPKVNKDYIYNYRDGSGFKYKGNFRNTAGWTTVEIAGKIIERVGPILATKY